MLRFKTWGLAAVLVIAIACVNFGLGSSKTRDRYFSDPPSGFDKNDLLLTTGLKIKLGSIR